MLLPPASVMLPAEASDTDPPGLATDTPSYCCTTPATSIEPPEASDRFPPVDVKSTRPEGNAISSRHVDARAGDASRSRREPPPSARGRFDGASSETAPAAESVTSTSAPVVTCEALTDRAPPVLSLVLLARRWHPR